MRVTPMFVRATEQRRCDRDLPPDRDREGLDNATDCPTRVLTAMQTRFLLVWLLIVDFSAAVNHVDDSTVVLALVPARPHAYRTLK